VYSPPYAIQLFLPLFSLPDLDFRDAFFFKSMLMGASDSYFVKLRPEPCLSLSFPYRFPELIVFSVFSSCSHNFLSQFSDSSFLFFRVQIFKVYPCSRFSEGTVNSFNLLEPFIPQRFFHRSLLRTNIIKFFFFFNSCSFFGQFSCFFICEIRP